MIQQLLAHLVGDYILQTDKMAMRKTSSFRWALFHALAYTLPFFFLTHHVLALLVICVTHAFIDRYKIAKYVVAFKNSLTDWDRRHEFFASPTGYAPFALFGGADAAHLPDKYGTQNWGQALFDLATVPTSLPVILLIITDNTLHLLINFAALRWL